MTEPPAGSRIGDVSHGLILVVRERRPIALADLAAGFVPLPTWMARDRAVDLEALRRQGFSDSDIWGIGSIAAFFNFSNRMASLSAMRPKREFYTMGRGQ